MVTGDSPGSPVFSKVARRARRPSMISGAARTKGLYLEERN